MRGHHDVEKDTKLDPYLILGKAQFERFTQWLLSKEVKEATSLFIISPVPILHWTSSILNYLDFGSNKDDLMDEWGHETHHWERNQLLEATFKQINTSGKIVVFLSGDVHCAASFRLHHKNYPSAKVYQVTSSAISRKPAPKVSTIGIASNGTMEGNDLVFCEKLYSFAGSTNFAMIRVKTENNHPEITVDLYWPGNNSSDHTVPDNEEVTRKRLLFS
jgi:alkaline phosphatase D